jgi:hypothetical protein
MCCALVDYYRNELKWNDSINPMITQQISIYTSGFKKKRAQDINFNTIRSGAYSYKAMEGSFIKFDKVGTYDSELFLIVSTLAFYLWLRIDEALTLKFGAIRLFERNSLTLATQYHSVRIASRKTDKTDTIGQVFYYILIIALSYLCHAT